MGQKVHPIGFRVGVYRDWPSRWFARGSYADQLHEDLKIRGFFKKTLGDAEISRVEIEKAGENIRVILFSGRPGIVIGKRGQGVDALRTRLRKLIGKKNVELSVQEVQSPELDPRLVAENIARQIMMRRSYKVAMRKAVAAATRSGARGVWIVVSGRLQGAEIARKESIKVGSVPLHTLRSNIDYGFVEAKTTFGVIGIKVFICRGDFFHI